MKTTGCNLDKVNMLPNALITPLISSTMIKSEDITPMEVTAEKRSPSIFKVSYIDSLVSALSHLNLKYKNSYSLSSLISFPLLCFFTFPISLIAVSLWLHLMNFAL